MSTIGTLLYGSIAYATFLGTIGYFFLFVGGIVVPKTVDHGAAALPGPAVAIDVALILLFGLQHSIMARPAFKRRLARVVPESLERSTFVLASGLVLALIFWLWRPIPAIVWQLDGGAAAIATGAFWGGVLLAVGSTFVFSHTELFGVQQVLSHARGRPLRPAALRMPFLYRVVRHPMHLGMLVVLWATPLMTAGHLLFALAMSAYVLIGIHFEERDLIRVFGDSYRAYRMEVPAVVPFLRPAVTRALRRRQAAVVAAGVLLAVAVTAAPRRAESPNAAPGITLAPLPRDSVRAGRHVRTFSYHVPPNVRSGAPVLIAMHGTGGSGERLRTFTGGALERLADRHGFIVVYPDAVGGGWNECRAAVTTEASRSGVDDVAMVSSVAGQLARRADADSTRLFALGYSGGGHLAYRLALEAPQGLRGVAVFAANLPVDEQLRCAPGGGAVSVMIANGTADLINPYDGGVATGPFGQRLGRVRSSIESAEYFATLAGATMPVSDDLVAARNEKAATGVARTVWSGKAGAQVVLYTVRGGGHVIPGQETRFPWLLGTTERDWSGLEEAIRFFGLNEAHRDELSFRAKPAR